MYGLFYCVYNDMLWLWSQLALDLTPDLINSCFCFLICKMGMIKTSPIVLCVRVCVLCTHNANNNSPS